MSTFDPSMFRAYDIRGTYPNQINEQLAFAFGQAFVQVMQAKKVVVGRDVRSSGVSLVAAAIEGVRATGAEVIEVGVISTEMLYFASTHLDCDGGFSLTASHNPPQWNGIKAIGKGAVALTQEGKLGEIYDFIQSGRSLSQFETGALEHLDLLPQYLQFLQSFKPKDLPPLKVVANVNFGANGKVVDGVVADLPLELIRLNWPEDGTFPKGTPDPLLPHNQKEISQRIVAEQANFGVAWDADADRAFFYDELGQPFSGYYLTALLTKHFLELDPGAAVVQESRLTWANIAAAAGGKRVISKTGHGYIKQKMREENAIFGGELSGHFYYRDFSFADNGLLTFLTVLGIFGQEIKAGRTVSALLDYYKETYPCNDEREYNFITDRASEIQSALETKYSDAQLDHFDGLTLEYQSWRCNIRMSSNEPVLRLNLEAKSQEELKQRRTELFGVIESFGASLRNDA